jgi:hypothetical protein
VADVVSSSASTAEETTPAADPDPRVTAAADASTEVAAPVISKPETVKPDTIALEIHALDHADIIFRVDGQPTETLSMMPGESATLRAEKEGTLIVSNTSALSARLNGKPLSFGPGMRAGEFVITRDGIDASRSVTGVAPNPPSPAPAIETPPPAEGETEPGGARNPLASPLRQRELMQAANSVRLVIKSPAIPEFLTVLVRADNEILFRREATALPPDGIEEGPRKFKAALATTPLSEERLIPPGSHTLQVAIFLGRTRLGQAQEISTEFNPKDRRTLLIEFAANPMRAGQRGAAGRFSIELE